MALDVPKLLSNGPRLTETDIGNINLTWYFFCILSFHIDT